MSAPLWWGTEIVVRGCQFWCQESECMYSLQLVRVCVHAYKSYKHMYTVIPFSRTAPFLLMAFMPPRARQHYHTTIYRCCFIYNVENCATNLSRCEVCCDRLLVCFGTSWHSTQSFICHHWFAHPDGKLPGRAVNWHCRGVLHPKLVNAVAKWVIRALLCWHVWWICRGSLCMR